MKQKKLVFNSSINKEKWKYDPYKDYRFILEDDIHEYFIFLNLLTFISITTVINKYISCSKNKCHKHEYNVDYKISFPLELIFSDASGPTPHTSLQVLDIL